MSKKKSPVRRIPITKGLLHTYESIPEIYKGICMHLLMSSINGEQAYELPEMIQIHYQKLRDQLSKDDRQYRKTYCYLLLIESPVQCIKIGISCDLDYRMEQLRLSGYSVKLIDKIDFVNRRIAIEFEHEILKIYFHKRFLEFPEEFIGQTECFEVDTLHKIQKIILNERSNRTVRSNPINHIEE